jgi:hypothetical protein
VWVKPTEIRWLGPIQKQELPSDCPCLNDRFERFVRQLLLDRISLPLSKVASVNDLLKLDLLVCDRNNAALSLRSEYLEQKDDGEREKGAVKEVQRDD